MDHLRDDQIKEAFHKVKKDTTFLNEEIINLKEDLTTIKKEMVQICHILEKLSLTIEKIDLSVQKTASLNPSLSKVPVPTHPTQNSTLRHINSTIQTENSEKTPILRPLNIQNSPFSTGNEGVPTDRQTNQQTDRHIENSEKTPIFTQKSTLKPLSTKPNNSIDHAAEMLDSLDSLKKEVRIKFKQLTEQEILVFSTLYQLEEEQGPLDYKTLANKLDLTESSIRDYVRRLLKKGIPVDKKRVNNKQILLSVSPNLKKVASLSTILQLRDL